MKGIKNMPPQWAQTKLRSLHQKNTMARRREPPLTGPENIIIIRGIVDMPII